MMLQTDVFFNFIEAHYDVFKKQDYTTLKQAYLLYKEYCAESGIERPCRSTRCAKSCATTSRSSRTG
jgi:hypothetical protein